MAHEHADLASLPAKRLPGDEVLCHGDPKIDNFGWTRIDGRGLFSDNDFDDAGFCPVADDALHYLVATDLAFGLRTWLRGQHGDAGRPLARDVHGVQRAMTATRDVTFVLHTQPSVS